MDHKIVGTVLPVLEISLATNEQIVAEAGALSWMTADLDMRTVAQTAGARDLFGVLKRAIGGGSIFMTEFTAQRGPGMCAFAAKTVGQILPVTVGPDQNYLIHRDGFLCATPGIEVSVGFQRRLGAGLFGGTGFILQRLSGNADAWIELHGEVVVYDLKSGETLRIQPGYVGMFEERVQFDIMTVPGIKNMLFGGEGIFLATLTGPGKVWLQSMPLPNLAHALTEYLPIQSH